MCSMAVHHCMGCSVLHSDVGQIATVEFILLLIKQYKLVCLNN